jgi:SAM-dependent methyltransferase
VKRLTSTITFEVCDAEALQFPDGSFGITSTFGVMIVSRPEVAAAEMARVTRKGGRLGLVTWLPGSVVEDIFLTMRPLVPPLPGSNSFMGQRGRLHRLAWGLGDGYERQQPIDEAKPLGRRLCKSQEFRAKTRPLA